MAEEPVKPTAVSIGSVQRIEPAKAAVDANNSNEEGVIVKDKEEEKGEEIDLTEDQIQKYLQKNGITDVKSIDELKSRLSSEVKKEVNAEPTEEEKQKKDAEIEKRKLDLFLANNGTIEGYAAIKSIASMDLTELSKKEIEKELKDNGWDDADIQAVLVERYYQINLDELEQDDDESNEEFEARKEKLRKKVEYGSSKLLDKGKNTQEKAKAILSGLLTAIEESDLQKQKADESEKSISSKTDEFFSKIPKQVTFELGKAADDSDINPVLYNVDDSDIKEVQELLKDKSKRDGLIFTPDGDVNIESIASLLLENRNLKKIAKIAFLKGGDDQVEHFKKVFPFSSPTDLGVGRSKQMVYNGQQKQKPASFGKTVKVN